MTEQAERRFRLRDGVEDIYNDILDAFYPKGREGLADDLDAELDATEPLQWMNSPTEAGWYWVMMGGEVGVGPEFVCWLKSGELTIDSGIVKLKPDWLFYGPLKPPEVPDEQG